MAETLSSLPSISTSFIPSEPMQLPAAVIDLTTEIGPRKRKRTDDNNPLGGDVPHLPIPTPSTPSTGRTIDFNGQGRYAAHTPTSGNNWSPRTSLTSPAWLGTPMNVEDVVRDVIMMNSKSSQTNNLITPDHPCFELSKKFWKQFNLPAATINNHIRLACGKRHLPLLLLLNPTDSHERPYTEMVEQTETLRYIEKKLQAVGLSLDDVSILDICPFFTDKWFQNSATAADDLDEAYYLTLKLLNSIRPEVIFVCQCQSDSGGWISKRRRQVSWKLCSRIERAENRLVHVVEVGDFRTHVVWGFHPSYVLKLGQVAESKIFTTEYATAKHASDSADGALTRLFEGLYSSGAAWAHKEASQPGSIWNEIHGEIKFQHQCIERQEAAIDLEQAEIQKLEDELSARKKTLMEERRVLRDILLRCVEMEQQLVARSSHI